MRAATSVTMDHSADSHLASPGSVLIVSASLIAGAARTLDFIRDPSNPQKRPLSHSLPPVFSGLRPATTVGGLRRLENQSTPVSPPQPRRSTGHESSATRIVLVLFPLPGIHHVPFTSVTGLEIFLVLRAALAEPARVTPLLPNTIAEDIV